MDIVIEAAKKINVCYAKFFVLSFQYAENRCRRRVVVRNYWAWRDYGIVPEEVENFCLDILSKKAVYKNRH